MVLLVIASTNMIMSCGDAKNAYFSGRGIGREVYSSQPRGGTSWITSQTASEDQEGNLRFRRGGAFSLVGFCEALEKDGWVQSVLEPALFYLRDDGGML
eukprot:1891353-Pyramimonas_sp.AAC.1